jgi:broad specificity phosphatase PhoE
VYASPLRRTRDTAAIIAEAVGVERVDVDERLREHANWGDVAGQSWDEFVMLWERSNEDRDFVVPGGVSATEAGTRAVAFVRDVVRELPAAEVVAVAHGGVIVDLLVELFGEAELLRRNPELRHMGWCAVTELALESEDPTLRRLADWAP